MAWSSAPADEMLSLQARIFLPSLLADENIALIAAYQNHRIVAGVIANRTSNVVGVSNMFVPVHEIERFQAGCIAGVIAAFPGLPVVGYEAGRELAVAQSLGFEVLGPVLVWVRVERRAD